MILWTSIFKSPNPARMEELIHCLEKNVNNREIMSIQLTFENWDNYRFTDENSRLWEVLAHPKIRMTPIEDRRTFNDWFRMANNLGERVPREPMIVANSDIYFDETIKLLTVDYLEKRFVCLSRRHIGINETGDRPLDESAVCAQDAWVFLAPVKIPVGLDFTTGRPGCDNRLAAEMESAGYEIANPSLSVRAFHVHTSRVKNYGPAVPGPHKLASPTTI